MAKKLIILIQKNYARKKENVTLFIAELQQKLSSTTQSFFDYLTVMVEYIQGCDHYDVLACTQIYSIRRHSFTPPIQTCFVRELGGKLLLKPAPMKGIFQVKRKKIYGHKNRSVSIN